MRRTAAVRGLYAIADTAYLDDARLTAAVEAALRGGANVIQYRDKGRSTDKRLKQARALRTICAARGACFLINDDVTLAQACDADGVHLGRNDPDVDAARNALGPHAIIGVSCYNDLSRAVSAIAAGADYVAFGSFFPSRTKPNAVRADPILLGDAKSLDVPVVAIGGITPDNGGVLIAAGADALAVISGVFDQPDVASAARRYAALFDRDKS